MYWVWFVVNPLPPPPTFRAAEWISWLPSELMDGRVISAQLTIEGDQRLKTDLRPKSPNTEFMMSTDTLEQTVHRANLDRIVIGKDLMMFPALLGGHADMRPALPVHLIAEDA